jgi:hypothetical protein
LLVFIVPLKSKKASKDWSLVSKQCNSTLRSILNQTQKEITVVLVCNELPENCVHDDRLHVVQKDFSLPSSYSESHQDQKRKIKAGLALARTLFTTAYYMKVDADDFVSVRLAEYISNNQCSGWFIGKGYIFNHEQKKVYKRNRFNHYNGSSHIIRLSAEELPKDENNAGSIVVENLWNHQFLKPHFKQINMPLEPFPFRAAVYTVGSSESLATLQYPGRFRGLKSLMWRIVNRVRYSEKFCKEFGISYEY